MPSRTRATLRREPRGNNRLKRHRHPPRRRSDESANRANGMTGTKIIASTRGVTRSGCVSATHRRKSLFISLSQSRAGRRRRFDRRANANARLTVRTRERARLFIQQIGAKRDFAAAESIGIRVRGWDEKDVRDAGRASFVGGSYEFLKPSASAATFGAGFVPNGTASASGRLSLSASPGRAGEIRQSVHKVARQKGVSSGRTYTSKYRGVHQTFPTGRWEAQFRRNGKPTSLGCFDREEEAAKAYDRMMLWCEMHASQLAVVSASPQKQGAAQLNFDVATYTNDLHALEHMSQDDLMLELRRLGRAQAGGQQVAFVP